MGFNQKKLSILLGAPTLRQETEHEERKTSRLELYFDLFFVAAIGLISHTFAHHIADHRSRANLGQLILQVTAVWWIWLSITYFFERFTSTGLTKRLFLFLTMFVIGAMTLSLSGSVNEVGIWFFGCYALLKFGLGLMFLRGLKSIPAKLRAVDRLNIVANISAASIILVGLFVDPTRRPMFFILSLIVDILLPLFHHKTAQQLPTVATDKFNERFGLFVIIVLGEAIVSVVSGISIETLSSEVLWMGAGALTLNFLHRWLYFDFVSRSEVRSDTIYAYAYLHLPLVISYTLIGSLILTITNHLDHISVEVSRMFTLTAIIIMIIIAIFENFIVGKHYSSLEKSRKTMTHMIIPILGMIGLLFVHVSPVQHIWILSGLVFIPILWRAIIWLRDPRDPKIG